MRQLLHIFKKDVRGLRGELAVFLGCLLLATITAPWSRNTVASGFSVEKWAGETVLLIAAAFLISRLVHAEAIPSDKEYWLTRPYRWTSLLGAKVLFVLVWLHLPVFVAQAVLASHGGFSVLANLSALLWLQVLMIVFLSLPALVLAAVTRGLTGFVVYVIGVFGSGVFVGLFDGPVPIPRQYFPVNTLLRVRETQWVVYAIFGVLLLVAVPPILLNQYRTRATGIMRGILIGFYVASLLLIYRNDDLRWTIQALAANRPAADTTSFEFSIGRATGLTVLQGFETLKGWPPPSFENISPAVHIPLALNGIPQDMTVGASRVSFSFESADGEVVKPERDRLEVTLWSPISEMWYAAAAPSKEFGVSIYFIDGKIYEKLRNRPVTVRGFVDLVIFRKTGSASVPKTAFPYNVTNSFHCDLENISRMRANFKDLSCHVAFRWPSQSIDADGRPFIRTESFSPFPADLRFNPILDEWRQPVQFLDEPWQQVDFTLKGSPSFVRKEFEIRNVSLKESPDIEVTWPGKEGK